MSSASYTRQLFVIILPTAENKRSDGIELAGTAKLNRATFTSKGHL
jgi:hypothetical protein